MLNAIALSGDYNYINQIETTIKSILYNNSNVKIYVINTDIPQEWFLGVNKFLKNTNNEIRDIKIDPSILQSFKTSHIHISNIAWARILIPKLISNDRILYLDSDIIVDDNIDELFLFDMDNYPIAAVQEIFQKSTGYFNSGVMVINNHQLRRNPNFVDELFKKGKLNNKNGDQTVLNSYFNRYYHLDSKYNFQIGFDSLSPSSIIKNENIQKL